MLYNLFENRDFVSVFAVALLAEGVDRNSKWFESYTGTLVALLAEGVDRNEAWTKWKNEKYHVALLAEGVDRNYVSLKGLDPSEGRPPRGGRG